MLPGYPIFQRQRPHLLALASYAALTVIALDNLVRHFATAIPATDGWDYAIHYWNLWWVKHALFDLHRDPMFSNYVLYPNTINLSVHTLSLTLGLFTAPLQFFLNIRLIYNGLIVGSLLSSAYFTFLFLRRHTRHAGIAALGGALFTFTPIMISRANMGQIHLIQTWWIPCQLLLWDQLISKREWRWRLLSAIGLGLAMYFAWMTAIEVVLWTLMLLAPYGFYTSLVECRGRERLEVMGLALLAGLTLLLPALIEPIPAMLQARQLTFPRVDTYSLQYFSYRLEWLVTRDPARPGESMGQLLPLLTLVSLPLMGRRRVRWLWLGVGLGAFILALGPFLNDTHIPLPYQFFHQLTGEQYRTPTRFTTPATFALVAFVSLSLANGLEHMTAGWRAWLMSAALLALVLDSGILAPFPISYLPDYRIYGEIGRDPAEYALLEVPVGPATGFGEFGDSPDLQYYAPVHHKQLINGTVSRVPSDVMGRYERSPLLRGLTGEYDFPTLDVASTELADKLNRWDMRYVLVHRDRLKPERIRAIVQFLNTQPELCLADEEGDLLAYQRIKTWTECSHPDKSALPDNTYRLAMGSPVSDRYVGPGWYDVEDIGGQLGRWAGEVAASTLRIVPPPGSHRIRFRAATYPANQTVSVSVNGQAIGAAHLTNDWAEYTFDLPADALRDDGPAIITLAHTRLESAFERSGGAIDDKRPLGAAYDYFAFEP